MNEAMEAAELHARLAEALRESQDTPDEHLISRVAFLRMKEDAQKPPRDPNEEVLPGIRRSVVEAWLVVAQDVLRTECKLSGDSLTPLMLKLIHDIASLRALLK